jgi:Uma2 family endonuclease
MNFMPSKITEGLPRRKFTVAEIEALVASGAILEDERFELIEGEVVEMSPKGAWHENLKRQLNEHLVDRRGARYRVIPETTFRLSPRTFIEPDFLVYPANVALAEISGANVLLAIEVADTSLAYDLKRKPLLYAHFGIRELWVIDAVKRVTTIHREPQDDAYRAITMHGPEETLTPYLAPELAVSLAAIDS